MCIMYERVYPFHKYHCELGLKHICALCATIFGNLTLCYLPIMKHLSKFSNYFHQKDILHKPFYKVIVIYVYLCALVLNTINLHY